ncbi:MAG: nucleoside 2-deoxyribosyltransferase [Syntrophobacteraceae bacterium]
MQDFADEQTLFNQIGTGTLNRTQQERIRIYFAAPLFSEAEREWIRSTIQKIESFAAGYGTKLEIIFPYDLITREEIERLGSKAKLEIFSRCKSHLDDADIVIALLDACQVDDGTAWEIGYFYARKSPEQKIIGIRTDFRRAGESEGAVVKDYASYCTSLVRSGINSVNDCLSPSFLP